jgi:hypothetical protein
MAILDNTDTAEPKSYLELMPENLRDPEALAKKAYNADIHIRNLETKSDELRTDYLKEREENQTRAKLEDLVKVLQEERQSGYTQSPVTESKPALDMTQIDTLLSRKVQEGLTAYETANRERDNVNVVVSKLKERFGDNYTGVVKQQITELGLSNDDFEALAKKSPATILKTLGVDDKPQTFQAPPRTSSQFTPKGQQQKTWSYYQNLKKENPRLYHNSRTTNEMTQMAEQLGDAFYDGDFGASDKQILSKVIY